jgi:hypothetical protein
MLTSISFQLRGSHEGAARRDGGRASGGRAHAHHDRVRRRRANVSIALPPRGLVKK